MESIKLITDSSCDLPKSVLEGYDITVLPIPITVDGIGYLEGIDFSPVEFYDILQKAVEIPKTAQITPFQYYEQFEIAYHKGYGHIITICLTSTGSSIFSSAVTAKELFFQRYPQAQNSLSISIVDSKTYSFNYGFAVLQAGKMAADGKSADEILSFLEDWLNRIEVYFAPFSFEYAKKSGRIGHSTAFVGEVLGLRALVSIIDGEMKIVAKPRGNSALYQTMLELAEKRLEPQAPYGFIKGTEPQADVTLRELFVNRFGYEPFGVYDAGPAIAINSGPRMIGVGLLGANRRTTNIK